MFSTRALAAIIVFLSAIAVAHASPSESKPAYKKMTPRKAITRRYDYNHNGRLTGREKADAALAIAQLRQQRAFRRNAQALSGF